MVTKLPSHKVTHWGVVDTPAGLPVLVQSTVPKVQLARSVKLPCEIVVTARNPIYHKFLLQEEPPSKEVMDWALAAQSSPLGSTMLPSPSRKKGRFFVKRQTMTEYSNGFHDLHQATEYVARFMKPEAIIRESMATNLSPLCLLMADAKWVTVNSELLHQLARTSTRDIIVEVTADTPLHRDYEWGSISAVPPLPPSGAKLAGYIIRCEMREEEWK